MLNRLQATRSIVQQLTDELVIASLGNPKAAARAGVRPWDRGIFPWARSHPRRARTSGTTSAFGIPVLAARGVHERRRREPPQGVGTTR